MIDFIGETSSKRYLAAIVDNLSSILTILFSSGKQRMGDMAADTFVVAEKDLEPL